jgi:putative ABC transport system permease protein
LPGGTFGQLPFRNVLRAPRRTLVTALGVGAAITALIGFVGLMDSLNATLDRGEREIVQDRPERTTVELSGYVPLHAPVVAAVTSAEPVASAEPVLRFPGLLAQGETEFPALVEVLDLASPIWHPTTIERAPEGDLPSIVLAEQAAKDLRVAPGDTVLLQHPRPTGRDAFELATTELRVDVRPRVLDELLLRDEAVVRDDPEDDGDRRQPQHDPESPHGVSRSFRSAVRRGA